MMVRFSGRLKENLHLEEILGNVKFILCNKYAPWTRLVISLGKCNTE